MAAAKAEILAAARAETWLNRSKMGLAARKKEEAEALEREKISDDLAWSKEAAEADAKKFRAKQHELEEEAEELKTTILNMEGEADDLRDTVSTLQGDLRAMEARFDAKAGRLSRTSTRPTLNRRTTRLLPRRESV